MAWGHTQTRQADATDVCELVDIVRLARQESPLSAQLCTPDSEKIAELLGAWLELEGSCLIVAESDDKIVGLALAQTVSVSLFSDVSFIQVETFFVREEFRRRGIGRSLMAEIAKLAEAQGAERVVTIVLTGSRQELRFLAGLGFAPAGARRIVETQTLNRRLSAPSGERRLRGIDELIARRRRTRDLSTAS